MDYHRQNNVRVKIIRIFNTYGPRMLPNDGRVVSNFILQALNNEDITIYGDGKQTRSFQYIDDLIEGMIRMMNTEDEFTGPINLGNPNERPFFVVISHHPKRRPQSAVSLGKLDTCFYLAILETLFPF